MLSKMCEMGVVPSHVMTVSYETKAIVTVFSGYIYYCIYKT